MQSIMASSTSSSIKQSTDTFLNEVSNQGRALNDNVHNQVHTSERQVAPIQEVFSSIQGEGVYIGQRQIFVRFAHCHLKCTYCDTPMVSSDGLCHAETIENNTVKDINIENPVPADSLITVLKSLHQESIHSISFTGGEPLLYHRFLKDVFKQTQEFSKTYLETSGTQAEFLASVLPHTDIIAMDIKLESSTGEPQQTENHKQFYDLAINCTETELFVKAVFNQNTTTDELDSIRYIVNNTRTPVILQPETDLKDNQVHLDPQHMIRCQDYLTQYFNDVRLIPQSHKMIRVR